MAKVNLSQIADELLVFLRNNIVDPSLRGTSTTDEFDGDGQTTAFTLTNVGVKNVSAVTVGGTAKTFGTDYTVSYGSSTTTVTFTTAPASGTDNVDVTYTYGQAWIYPDTPRTDLRLSSFPRISVTDVSSVMTEAGLNADTTRMSMVISITIYSADAKAVKDLINDIKDIILDNKKSFYYFNLIIPVGISPVRTFAITEGQEEIVQQSIDCEIPFIFEN